MSARGGLLAHWCGRPVAELARSCGIPHLEVWDRIPSTSDRLRLLEAEGAPEWTTVVAVEQSAGRGRVGRIWHSEAGGGLWFSVLIEVRRDAAQLLPLRIGLCLAEAIERFGSVPGSHVEVKWPNDLLVGGRKLGGILCESRILPEETPSGSPLRVIAGIGINLGLERVGVPPELQDRAIGLGTPEVPAPSPAGLLEEILRAFVAQGWGDAPPRMGATELERLSLRDALRGRRIRLETGGEAEGIGFDPSGGLRVRLPDGSEGSLRSAGVDLMEPVS